MPTRKPKDDGGDHDDPLQKPHTEPRGAVKIHEAYLEHRLGGGAEATPDRYRRGLEQFEKLPGAVRSTPPATPAAEPEKPPTTTGQPSGDGEAE